MKKSLVVLLAMFVLVCAAFGTVLAEENGGWSKLSEGQYQLVGQLASEPVFVREDSQADFSAVAQAREKNSENVKFEGRHPALPKVVFTKLDSSNNAQEMTSTPVQVAYDVLLPKNGESKHHLYLHQLEANGQKLLLTEPESGSVCLLSDKHQKKYVFVDENLWLFDSEAKAVKQLTKDKVGNYDRVAMVQNLLADSKKETFVLHWAINPHWNNDASLISYETNRGFTNSGMSIWLVNPVTGEEKAVISANDGLVTLGWVDQNRLAYYERVKVGNQYSWDVKVTDITTDTVSTLANNVRVLGVEQNFIVYGKVGAPLYEVSLLALNTGRSTELAKTKNNYMFDHFANFSPNGTQVVLKSRNMNGKQVITLVDLKTMETKDLHGPWGHMITTDPIWLDDSRIMIQTAGETAETAKQHNTWVYRF